MRTLAADPFLCDNFAFLFFRIHHRYPHRIQATVLQENEEKIAVEESFQPKSSPENGGDNGNQPEPSSNGLEKLVIKLEQSINVFLTV